MLTLSAFASLAQLGSGLALALTIFIEPISSREELAQRQIDNALKLIPSDGSSQSIDRKNELLVKLFQLDVASRQVALKSKAPMLLVKVGALLNFIVLLLSTIFANYQVNVACELALLVICIAPVAAGYFWLARLSRSAFQQFSVI